MLLGAVAQAQNFAITATTEAAIRKNIVKGNAANYGFGMINDTLKLVGLTTRNVIFTGSTSKTDIGLGNVDNTSDLNKPVSTATQTALNLKQNQLNGTGFVKATGTTISYDNSTYLSTSTAVSTYLPISNPTATGTLTAPTIANSLGATFATSSGNVGIGTTSPAYKGHIYGGGEAIVGGITNAGAKGASLLVQDSGGGVGNGGALVLATGQGVGGAVKYESTDGSNFSKGDLSFQIRKNTTDTFLSTALQIKSTGNVGIGTTAPTEKLEVFNGNYTNLKISANQQSSIKLNTTTLYGVNNPNAELYNNYGNVGLTLYPTPTATRNDIIYYDNTDKETQFQTDGSTKLRIRGNGNVGIGVTTDAGYKLDVNGTARVTGNSIFSGNVGIGTTNTSYKINTLSSTAGASVDGINIGITDATAGITHNTKFFTQQQGSGIGRTLLYVASNTTGLTQGQLDILTENGGNFISQLGTGYGGTNSLALYDLAGVVKNNINTNGNSFFNGGNIGIGTTSPNASSILDITSTTKGVLFPRMTTGEINNITSPADGLTVYNTTLKVICFYDSSAAVWKKVSHSNM
jgi:hypothetical protein